MRQLLSLVTRQHFHLLYTLLLVQRNRWFANSDVPFQSATNDLLRSHFAMQTYVLHQGDITSELSHLHRVITKQLMYTYGSLGFVRTYFWSRF